MKGRILFVESNRNIPKTSTLPPPELNPLLNPVLADHMGRWAQVYFTSPPEKREEGGHRALAGIGSGKFGPSTERSSCSVVRRCVIGQPVVAQPIVNQRAVGHGASVIPAGLACFARVGGSGRPWFAVTPADERILPLRNFAGCAALVWETRQRSPSCIETRFYTEGPQHYTEARHIADLHIEDQHIEDQHIAEPTP